MEAVELAGRGAAHVRGGAHGLVLEPSTLPLPSRVARPPCAPSPLNTPPSFGRSSCRVVGLSFHPGGTHLASSSGDGTAKIWEFEKRKCVLTLSDHTQAVWSVAYHYSGDFLASGSLDHSARLWDLATGRCKSTLRGHVDSVNEVCWQPYSNILATASSDKTLSLWDVRSGLCAQTFYGHMNRCALERDDGRFPSPRAFPACLCWSQPRGATI